MTDRVYSEYRKLVVGRASFTDYSKATLARMFYTAYTGVVETNYLTHVEYNILVQTKGIVDSPLLLLRKAD